VTNEKQNLSVIHLSCKCYSLHYNQEVITYRNVTVGILGYGALVVVYLISYYRRWLVVGIIMLGNLESSYCTKGQRHGLPCITALPTPIHRPGPIKTKLYTAYNYLRNHKRSIWFPILAIGIGAGLTHHCLRSSLRPNQETENDAPASGILIWSPYMPAREIEIAIIQSLLSNTHLCNFVTQQQYKPGSFGEEYKNLLKKYTKLSTSTAPTPRVIEYQTSFKDLGTGETEDLLHAGDYTAVAADWISQYLSFPQQNIATIKVNFNDKSLQDTVKEHLSSPAKIIIVDNRTRYSESTQAKNAATPASFKVHHEEYRLTAIIFRESFNARGKFMYTMAQYNATWYLFSPRILEWYISPDIARLFLAHSNVERALNKLTTEQISIVGVRKHSINTITTTLNTIPKTHTIFDPNTEEDLPVTIAEAHSRLQSIEAQETADQILQQGIFRNVKLFKTSDQAYWYFATDTGFPRVLFYELVERSSPEKSPLQTFNDQLMLLSLTQTQ